MVLLAILLALAVIILILCFCPLTFFISYIDGELNYKLKYLMFNIVTSDEKKHNKRKAKHNKKRDKLIEKQENSIKDDGSDENRDLTLKKDKEYRIKKSKRAAKKQSLKSKINSFKDDKVELLEKIKLIKDLIYASKKGIKRILKGIYIKDIFIDFTISDEDAYECAMKYGKMNILVYNVLGFLSSYFKVSKKSIAILCRFNEKDSIYNFSFNVKLKLGTAIVSVLGMILTFFVNNIRSEKEEKNQNKEVVHEG
ncbi:MAG: DUF2953 domain-containing protein [Clostridiales bacterium]|jgi:hypothetical protein|nr:DUF2953 domain-containing protein [Clostridiales bacterium]